MPAGLRQAHMPSRGQQFYSYNHFGGGTELCRYHTGPFDAENWSVPLRAVGWLEYPHQFNTGATPNELVPRLEMLIKQTRTAYSHYSFRGMMDCSICKSTGLHSPGPIWSQENILVPGNGAVFAAPGGIVHYVEVHSYRPPKEFIDAVLKCPDCDSREYRDALYSANGGNAPPLKSRTW